MLKWDRFAFRILSLFIVGSAFLACGFLSQNDVSAETETIPTGVRKSNHYTSKDYIIEAGGCFHVIPTPTDVVRANAWFSNNFQIAGQGFHYTAGDGTVRQEDSGAIRVCVSNSSQIPGYVSHAWFAGTITLGANATIGIQQNDAQKNAYLNSLAANDASYVLTLSPCEASDVFVILGNNESFTNPISILKGGTVQVGKIDATPLVLYDQVNTSTTHSVSFDGTVGSLGSGDVTVGSSSATLRWQRTGNVEIANKISGSGKLVFDGDALYSFAKTNALTGVTGTVTVNSDASVKLYGGSALAQTNSNVKFAGSGTLIFGYDKTGEAIVNFPAIANLDNFTGTVLMADGYRYSFGPGNYTSNRYRIGATDGGQILLNSNGNYAMTLNIEGLGKQRNESFGAIRMTGQSNYQGAMTNLGGTVYLTDEARIGAGNTPAAGNGVSTTHNQGMVSANIISQDSVNKAALRVNGTPFINTWTHLILTGSANDYGKTFIEGKAILQVGYSGMVNDSASTNYDGTTGALGVGDVVFCDINGVTGTTNDLGGKLIFARTDDCAVSNAFVGAGTLEFTAGGRYSLTNAEALTNFSGSLSINDGSALTLSGQTVPNAAITLDGGALLGIGTLNVPLTMNSGTLASGIHLTQNDLTLNGTYLANLDDAVPGESLTSVSGTLELTNGSTLKLVTTTPDLLEVGDTFLLLEGNTDSFAGLDLSTILIDSDKNWSLQYFTGDDGSRILGAVFNLPEPSTLVLLGFGLISGFIFKIRSRKS